MVKIGLVLYLTTINWINGLTKWKLRRSGIPIDERWTRPTRNHRIHHEILVMYEEFPGR
jgi:hypothetical protein